MEKNLFSSARLKVEWANEHIQQLSILFEEFSHSNFYKLSVEKDLDTGNYLLKLEMVIPIPRRVPLLIGDAIHNLRSSLDHVAFEIVSMAGKKPSHDLYFPIAKDRHKLKNVLQGGEIKLIGKDILDLIYDSIKPYPGGNDPLVALNQLDIMDKHWLLIPLISVVRLDHVNGRIGTNRLIDCSFSVGSGTSGNLIASPEKFEMEDHGKPTFGIFFDKGNIFEGRPVFPTLPQISQVVSGVIEAIEKKLLARS